MGRTYTNINVHIIFHVKGSECTMAEEDLPQVFRYIGGTIRVLSGHAYIVGGRTDHIHILASVPVSSSLSDFVGRIKSNTSRWIKGLGCRYSEFAWQEGYGAFSVSESNKDKVIKYISNQKQHHQHRTAHEEFAYFIEKHTTAPDRENHDCF